MSLSKRDDTQPYWHVCRRVYLAWAIIIALGFITTHFHQLPDINIFWSGLSALGLGYMFFLLVKLRFREPSLLYVGLVWLVTISFGLTLSILAFTLAPLGELTTYLGSFWLLVMGVGLAFNGLVDRNRIYFIVGGIDILAGLVCYVVPALQPLQYLVAGAVGSLTMVGLIL